MIRSPRALLAAWASIWIGAQPIGAFSHDAEWRDINRFVPPPAVERWLFASNTTRRADVGPRAPRQRPANMVAVTAPAPGQGGYVHYFVIELPDGEHETQVGIELPDGRIAWSFPELGVVVSPFIASGAMQAGKHSYPVRHLYGIRPFRSEAAMLELQKDLWRRIIPWVEDATPYCALAASPGQPCLSCLGLVLRVLYPSRSGGMPDLPRDFGGSSAGPVFTTDDLLLYQAGLQGQSSAEQRLARIHALALPQNLRDDLVHLVQSLETADGAASRPEKARKQPGRSVTRAGPARPPTRKKL
jgi:hypothetical protein